jgi:hypothetical protein
MTPQNHAVPGLTRDLTLTVEAPGQVRGAGRFVLPRVQRQIAVKVTFSVPTIRPAARRAAPDRPNGRGLLPRPRSGAARCCDALPSIAAVCRRISP